MGTSGCWRFLKGAGLSLVLLSAAPALHGQVLGHVAVVVGTYSLPAVRPELVFNGDIERMAGSYGPIGWDKLGMDPSEATWDDHKAASGRYSLKLTQVRGGPVHWSQHIPAPPAGSHLRLRAAVAAQLGEGGSVVVRCGGLGVPGSRAEVIRSDLGPEWSVLEVEGAVAEHVSNLVVRAELRAPGTAWFDDFSLTPVAGEAEAPADLHVLLPLPPACRRQIPLATRLEVEPAAPARRVTLAADAEQRRALGVQLTQVKGLVTFRWSTLILLGAIGAGPQALDEPIGPPGDVPAAVRPFLEPKSVSPSDARVAGQQLTALGQAATYADVLALYRNAVAASAKLLERYGWSATRGDRDRLSFPHRALAVGMFRLRGAPARVARVLPVSGTRLASAGSSGETVEVYVHSLGWAPLPPSAGVPRWPALAVLDVLPPGQDRGRTAWGDPRPRGFYAPPDPRPGEARLPQLFWDWRPARAVYRTTLPPEPYPWVSRPSFSWAASPVKSLPFTQDDLSGLQATCADRWHDSLAEVVAGAPPATFDHLLERLQTATSADELAAVLHG